jgi:uncharacterized membrane protein YsdA (DUF1294 family)
MDFIDLHTTFYLFAYYVVVSAVALTVMAHDKLAARAERQRVAEKTLYLLSAAGGWPGTWVACGMFRHKTRKSAFQMRLAFATLLNPCILGVLLKVFA